MHTVADTYIQARVEERVVKEADTAGVVLKGKEGGLCACGRVSRVRACLQRSLALSLVLSLFHRHTHSRCVSRHFLLLSLPHHVICAPLLSLLSVVFRLLLVSLSLSHFSPTPSLSFSVDVDGGEGQNRSASLSPQPLKGDEQSQSQGETATCKRSSRRRHAVFATLLSLPLTSPDKREGKRCALVRKSNLLQMPKFSFSFLLSLPPQPPSQCHTLSLCASAAHTVPCTFSSAATAACASSRVSRLLLHSQQA